MHLHQKIALDRGQLVEQSERSTAGFLDRLVAAGQPERTQMRDTFDAFVRDEEKFPAPNRAVQAVAGAVPRNAERGRRNFIFRHARQDVGDVMLDADYGRDALLRVLAERQLGPTGLLRKLRREIIRVQIGGDDLRLGLVKIFEIGDDTAEGGVRLLRFQIANVLADENLVADRQRNGVFQMSANGQNNFRRTGFYSALIFLRLMFGSWNSPLRLLLAAVHSHERGAAPTRGPASRAQSNHPRAGRWGDCGREKHRRCRRAAQRLHVRPCKSVRR